ncbi:DNA mismatch repair protein msh6 [Coemansia sp. Benny D115]|nr:DNA mismatch repair protein msh6 [Coemansia sp. Benny D115]
MAPPGNTGTPKGAKTQTSIFSFFSTPKKTKDTSATAPPPPKFVDSQDELLAGVDDMIDDDMLALADESKVKQPSTNLKRKAASTLTYKDDDEDDDDDGSDADAAANDDDDDDDYNPVAAPTPGKSVVGRGRAIADDSDDDMMAVDVDDDLLDLEPPSSPLASRSSRRNISMLRRNSSSRGSSSLAHAAHDVKRIRHSNSGVSGASEEEPLMSAVGKGAPNPPTTPMLERTTTSMSALSVASSGSTPMMQRLKLQPSLQIPEDSKKERVAKFAKKNEERYAWLEDVRDAQGLRPNEVGYDKRTLYIPKSAWNAFSPFEKQYWEIKSQHWDTVVFFKKGKFYELYENDATIGSQEFDLKMTDRVNMRMAGVPESSFDHWVAQFLAKGHKVARVDQMETKLAKDMRERGSSKKGDGLVSRELTGILTVGTLVDPSLLTQDLSTYCMSIVEVSTPEDTDSGAQTCSTSFGVAFVDTSTAQFHMCTIANDDADRSGLETLLVQVSPREVIYVRGGAGPGQRVAPGTSALSLTKGASTTSGLGELSLTSPDAWDGMAGISQPTWRTLKNTCGPSTDWIAMAPRREFWDVPTTKSELERSGYFGESENGKKWPEALEHAAEKEPAALMAVGGLLSYLRTLKLDHDLASLGNFSFYSPIQSTTSLVLDGPTISNLDIFAISSEGSGAAGAVGALSKAASIEGTLFALINHARTPFGRRLLSRWTCHPLKHTAAINARLDAVDFFLANSDLADDLADTLAGLMDLERGLSRIHSGRCKVADFIGILGGLKTVARMISDLRSRQSSGINENGEQYQQLPARIVTLLRVFPPLDDILSEYTAAFDEKLATTEGRLLPFAGSDQPFDEVTATIAELDAWLEKHLQESRKKFGCSSIVYKNMGKEHYQLEMPASIKVPANYLRLSATKAVSRYWSPELRAKVQERAEALETKSMVLESYKSRLYARFDRHYALLMKATTIVAELDCLLALSTASRSLGSPASRPVILESNGTAGGYIEFRQLRHPCVALSASGGSDFVSNDIVLGRRHADSEQSSKDAASMILLTGPNMGGKSTLLRQLCLGVILAQLGCYVPAESAVILPVDRLFTRIGARDNLLAGRSTFMVEMAETSTILRYATPQSLVVLDELGRGTSTHDGEAVAYGVLHSLCSRLGCLGFFSTHYGLLADSLLKPAAGSLQTSAEGDAGLVEPHLRPMHMACAVNEEEHRVTFLYRLQHGIAEKSHGMNVAAMAGVPVSIVRSANAIAHKFEQDVKRKQLAKAGAREGALSSADGSSSAVPLTLQSDFANLLRMAALEAKAQDAEMKAAADDAVHVPVGGVDEAKKANENQYWGCIVDHLCRTMQKARSGNLVPQQSENDQHVSPLVAKENVANADHECKEYLACKSDTYCDDVHTESVTENGSGPRLQGLGLSSTDSEGKVALKENVRDQLADSQSLVADVADNTSQPLGTASRPTSRKPPAMVINAMPASWSPPIDEPRVPTVANSNQVTSGDDIEELDSGAMEAVEDLEDITDYQDSSYIKQRKRISDVAAALKH